MSERRKEWVWTAICFALSILLAINAVLGKVAFGQMSMLDTRQICAVYSVTFVLCAILGLIGDQRLNDWINPRLKAYSQRRKDAKARRKGRQAELDLKDPGRVMKRERRKQFLHSVAMLVILCSPIVVIIVFVLIMSFGAE